MVLFPDPAYPDSSYYVDVARALAAGHGLNVDFVWIFAEVGGVFETDGKAYHSVSNSKLGPFLRPDAHMRCGRGVGRERF